MFIYSLSDGSKIRYVGKTNNLKKRFIGHLTDAKRSRDKSYRSKWINSLLNENRKPTLDILDIVPDEDWEFWEKYWISQIKTWGFSLVNLTEGGGNPPSFLGKTHSCEYKLRRKIDMSGNLNPSKMGISEEWRKNISKSLKNKPLSEQHKKSLGKKILQLSLNNDIIAMWPTISEASRNLNISLNGIAMCVRGERKKSGGYKWKIYDDSLDEKICLSD
jgi:group I intron endonuclease